jgi:predicted metalloprotease with PDZ domain
MTGSSRRLRIFSAGLLLLGGLGGLPGARAGEGPTLRLEIDARDLPRRLMHSRIEVPCRPGKLALWYPKWVPGTHSPCGPIQDVAGLRLETPDCKAIPWRRDETDVFRVECDVPSGVGAIIVRLDTICNEAAVSAAGYLTFGNESVGIINWATCLMYPEGPTADDTRVALTLRLPPTWSFATALEPASGENAPAAGKPVTFRTVSLTDLADNPMIAGEHVRTIPLDTGKYPPAFLDLASESAAALQVGPEVVATYGRVVQQAGALFGTCHYPSFHFLVTCSDRLGYLGLEHLACSINGVHERDLLDPGRLRGWVGNLLPHEYVHSWCGKFRRPAGMCTPNFQTPQKTRLLWVYEGLTEYLGEILMVRSGMIDAAEYKRTLTATIGSLSRQEGRRWRSLEDTAVASHLLRDGGPNWSELRRGQDYYFEGALLWLEADAIIRERSYGKKSLDDFCREFLGGPPTSAHVSPYELADVVRVLRELADFDWDTFFLRRTTNPLEALPLEVLGRCGYRLEYTTHPPASGGISRRGGGGVSARDSLGLGFDSEGRIVDVVPGRIGDRSGLAPGMKVIGVNGKTFSGQRLLDALADSVARRKIEFLLIEGETFRTIVLDYADGPRYLELVRDPAKPDLLAEILKPLDVRNTR